MEIGVVGLGLIGGSLAKAIKANTDHTIYGTDISVPVIYKARLLDAIDDRLTDARLSVCEILILAIYPDDTIRWLQENASKIRPGAIVVDCCGVKGGICRAGWDLAARHGFTFVGGHPMEGIEKSGFEHSKKSLFQNASMIFVPDRDIDLETMKKLKDVFDAIGFSNYEIATPERHDRIIAYTSQLAHVLSSAYVKSPTAEEHKGFSAGSFRDMTRVAYLNEQMWTELFLLNREPLTQEIDSLIDRLKGYSEAIKSGDEAVLKQLLKEGRERKTYVDGM